MRGEDSMVESHWDTQCCPVFSESESVTRRGVRGDAGHVDDGAGRWWGSAGHSDSSHPWPGHQLIISDEDWWQIIWITSRDLRDIHWLQQTSVLLKIMFLSWWTVMVWWHPHRPGRGQLWCQWNDISTLRYYHNCTFVPTSTIPVFTHTDSQSYSLDSLIW